MLLCSYFIAKSLANEVHDTNTVSIATCKNRSIYLYLYSRSGRHLTSLPLQCKSHSRPVYLCVFLLLAGDIASNPGPLQMSYTNIRSIRNKFSAIQNHISARDIDIFALSETWLSTMDTDSFISEITPPGYVFHHQPRLAKKGGGVGFFVRDTLNHSIIKCPKFASFEHIALSVKLDHKCFNLVCIYRPPNQSVSKFLEDFSALVEFFQGLAPDTVFIGDFNIDLNKSSTDITNYKGVLASFNLKQHVDFLTHLRGGILDHLISPSGSGLIHKVCISDCFSDHMCLSAILNCTSPNIEPPTTITYRQFQKINMSKLKDDLSKSDLIIKPESSLDSLFDQYQSTLNDLLDLHAPIKTKKLTHQPVKWFTPEVRDAKRQKRRLERIWRRTKSPADRSKFRRQVNRFNVLINSAKKDFYTNLINTNCDDSKKMWKSLNSVLHRKPVSVLPDGASNQSLADKFADFFVDKITRIRDAFPVSSAPNIPPPHQSVPKFCSFAPVSEDDVRKVIMSSPTKSCSLDSFPTFLVKDCLSILLQPITRMVNLSLSRGVFIDKFKQAIVTPLIKKPSLFKDDLRNYRPISGLSFISKVIERVVAKQLKSHLSSNNMDNIHQSAYKSGHSTETALLKIKNDISLNLAQGKPTALVLLDLSAAFDTIDHQQLTDHLSSWYGFSGNVSKWFRSYLTGRKQSVKVFDAVSASKTLDCGVPQGSVLGPLLFVMYTAPLSFIISAFKSLTHHLYADDTQIYICITPQNASTAIPELQSCLESIQSWMAASKLKLNPSKTEFILFGSDAQRRQLSHLFPINILGNPLTPVDKVRNLGVLFDAGFSFTNQVSQIRKSCSYHIRDFARVRRHLTRSVAIILANALVSSRLDYCNSLLYGITGYNLRRLEGIQNSLCRIVTRASRYSSITPHLKSLHWLPIASRIQFKICLITFKTLLLGQPTYFVPLLVPYSCAVATRLSNPVNKKLSPYSFDYKIHKSKKHFNASYSVAGPKLWNSLPFECRTANSVGSFRKHLKSHLFRLAFPP